MAELVTVRGDSLVQKITINGASVTTRNIPESIFGANAVYQTNTNGGNATATYKSSLKALEIQNVRFPGGRGDHADAELEGSEWLNIVKMVNGELRREVQDFLDWCSEEGIKTTLVLPTKFLDVAQYYGFCTEMENFVATVLSLYPEEISAFEIGNEYWEMGETAYATKANMAISAIENGMERAKMEAEDRPLILVQMATPNVGSEFHINAPDMEAIPYTQRLELANEKLIDGLSEDSKSLIGGVVEHYYYSKERIEFSNHNDETNFIGRDFEIWENRISHPLELHITEWNIKTTNLAENGMRSAGTIIHQLESMVGLGVDAASIWAIQHNTTTDLTGNNGDSVKQDVEGNVVNTIRGAAFDMLSSSVVGLHSVELDLGGAESNFHLSAFGDDQDLVLFFASRSFHSKNIEISLGDQLSEYSVSSGKKLSYDPSSSDGKHYDPKQGKIVEANGLDLNNDGAPDYFINEHDVHSLFKSYSATDFGSDNCISFSLKPFEVMQLNFQNQPLGSPDEISDSKVNYRIDGGKGDDLIVGDHGIDKIKARGGNDIVKGGNGGDEIHGGRGEDKLLGQSGSDKLSGGSNGDLLKGHQGRDLLIGNRGNDLLKGGAGKDVLDGGPGNDLLVGGGGVDTFIFKGGNDKIIDFAIGETVHIDLSAKYSRDSGNAVTYEVSFTEDGLLLDFDTESSIEIIGLKSLEDLAEAILFASYFS